MTFDLSDIVTDADLGGGPITVIRTTRMVTNAGTVQTAPGQLLGVFGVMVPASPRDLQRLPEVDRVSASISLYTNVKLSVGSANLEPDVIYCEGDPYLVKSVMPYGAYGFWSAIATMTTMQPTENSNPGY
jgi:hypothetical protein